MSKIKELPTYLGKYNIINTSAHGYFEIIQNVNLALQLVIIHQKYRDGPEH